MLIRLCVQLKSIAMVSALVVESVWTQTTYVGGVCMEDSAVKPLTPVLYQLE